MALTIDCGEGKHDLCIGWGTAAYLIPQVAGQRFDCKCPCHRVNLAAEGPGYGYPDRPIAPWETQQ